MSKTRLPKEGLVRAQQGDYELREASDGSATMFGHFAVFDRWTEINSRMEGNFMERVSPGAFKKTFSDNGDRIRVLFNHGHDVMGDQVLGAVEDLREDDRGAYYEVKLFDGVPQLIKDGLRANQYGASFRFRVTRELIEDDPGISEANPKGIPERTIKEAEVVEFGPVTWPAYADATAGVRSMTDEYIAEQLGAERLAELATNLAEATTITTEPEREAPADTDAAPSGTSEPERREDPPPTSTTKEHTVDPNKTLTELEAREKEITLELERIDADAGTAVLSEAQQEEFDALVAEREETRKQVVAKRQRMAAIESASPVQTEGPVRYAQAPAFHRDQTADIYDLSTIRGAFDNPAYAAAQLRDRAMRSIETSNFPALGRRASKEDMQGRAEQLLNSVDDDSATLARRILVTGHPQYESAFWKKLTGRQTSAQESALIERAALLAATAGYAMPYTLDPTVLLTSNGAINPIRQVARVVQITGQTWNGVNSAGVTASFDAEGTEVSEDTPTLTQPTVTVLKAAAFVPYSIEAENWADLRNELTSEFQDAKDVLEAQKFTLGTGTPEPGGFIPGSTNLATTAATATLASADLDTLADALPPRFQSNAVWMASRKFYSKVRQISRAAGVTEEWAPARQGFPPSLLGKPAYEASDVSGSFASAQLVAAYGDFQKGYLIVDRVGMNVEYIPHLFNLGSTTNPGRPVGARGLYCYWMTNGYVRSTAPIRVLKML